MPARAEALGDRSIGREELLGMSRRLKPLHAALPLAGGLMGVLGAVVQVAMLTMFHTREALVLDRTVAFQLISDQDQGDVLAPLEQLAEKFLGG
jgi:hypothetical protein